MSSFRVSRTFCLGILQVLFLCWAPLLSQSPNSIEIDGTSPDWEDGEACFPDEGGQGDESQAQSDMTFFCAASNWTSSQAGNTLYVRWNYEQPNLSGANTSDACIDFDTDGDGNVNYSFCLKLLSGPALGSPGLFQCKDSNALRCASPSTSVTWNGSCGILESSATNPFGSTYDPDVFLECSMPLADIGQTAGALVMVNVCTKPSSSPTSDPKDCALENQNRISINTLTGVNVKTNSTSIDLLTRFSPETYGCAPADAPPNDIATCPALQSTP